MKFSDISFLFLAAYMVSLCLCAYWFEKDETEKSSFSVICAIVVLIVWALCGCAYLRIGVFST